MKLLSLEQNAILTQINNELDLFGFTCLVKRDGIVDFRLSVYEVLNHINAKFPELDISFGEIWEKTCNYVAEWSAHFKKLN